MSGDPTNPVYQRIKQRMDELGLSERGAAEKSGLSAAAIRNIRKGQSRTPRIYTLSKLAPILKTTPEWLAFGLDEGAVDIQEDATMAASSGLPVVGEVAAGRWLEADDHVDEPAFDPVPVQPDPRWPLEDQFGLVVRGTSLNRVALDGDILACVAMAVVGQNPREDDLIIVEMRRAAGLLRQRTAKRYQPRGTHIELWPDSNDPRWQKPIIIPRGRTPLQSAFEDEESRIDVNIAALVTWVHRPIQRRRR